MTASTRLLALVMLAAAAPLAFAAAESAPPAAARVEVITARADLAAAEAVLARPEDTTYEMSTGRHMTVASLGDALRVRYGRRAPATLRYDGQGRFVSQDGQLRLRFVLDAKGDPQQVQLALPAAWQ